MTVFDQLFDEAFYLNSYPDVRTAVQAGIIPSGRSHFLSSGIREGRTRISRFYRDDVEARYLTDNPDVATAVASEGFASGLQHYLGNGEGEGRSLFPGGFDEAWYRRRYPDVNQAIAQGVFTSGLEHYLAFGRDETRSVSPLFELNYFSTYSDVLESRNSGGPFLSAADHFQASGLAEGRSVVRSGTAGNDTIVSVGSSGIDTLTGVELDAGRCFVGGTLQGGQCREYDSFGRNEQDILIGNSGPDVFELGVFIESRSSVNGRAFYVGNGDQDFARLQNFEVNEDIILFPTVSRGPAVPDLSLEVVGNDTHLVVNGIAERDLIAIIEGVTPPNGIQFGTPYTGGTSTGVDRLA